jgi:hypothetical protein
MVNEGSSGLKTAQWACLHVTSGFMSANAPRGLAFQAHTATRRWTGAVAIGAVGEVEEMAIQRGRSLERDVVHRLRRFPCRTTEGNLRWNLRAGLIAACAEFAVVSAPFRSLARRY